MTVTGRTAVNYGYDNTGVVTVLPAGMDSLLQTASVLDRIQARESIWMRNRDDYH